MKIDRQLRVLLRRFLTQGGVAVDVAVTAGAATKAIVFADGKQESDANYGVFPSVSWNSTVWVTAKTLTGFTLNFSVVAPANALASYAVLRGDI